MNPVVRREYAAEQLAQLLELPHKNKRLVNEIAMAAGPLTGTVSVTRWIAGEIPTERSAVCEFVVKPGYFDYAGPSDGVWYVNFADPDLFFAYGGGLLAQDELQCAEHPALGGVREALVAEGLAALTEQHGIATPVLVANVERRVAIEGIYGNAFSRASPDKIRAATHPRTTRSNILAIAAPTGGGNYTRDQIEYAVTAAYTGFAAARAETDRMWPGSPTEICTGFWGCGAFGGNRELMTLVQLYAAELAGIDQLSFYAFDDAGRADFEKGRAALTNETSIDAMVARGYEWGFSNGT